MKLTFSVFRTMFFVISANALAQSGSRLYKDEHVQFSYPTGRYSGVRVDESSPAKLRTYLLRLKEIDSYDVLTVCKGDLRDCGSYDEVKPYWYSEDGELMLFSATTLVKQKKRVVPGKTAFEAFPICPTTDKRGQSHVYGAECYELVVTGIDQTFSITYWIGELPKHASRMAAARKATRIVDSVVLH